MDFFLQPVHIPNTLILDSGFLKALVPELQILAPKSLPRFDVHILTIMMKEMYRLFS